uniref:Transcription initiation factor IIF subunit alpha n=1 Tax=Denticeps clupeoides TaxID=299321 RepID=A0AAY4CB82_9TELE
MASLVRIGGGGSSATEYVVRVPKNTAKKYSIMAFNAGDKVNCSTWTQARMERDMSNRRMYAEEEATEGAAGSEFGKKQREEARRKKYGIITREFKAEDQPWILKVNGKAGKRFKGQKKGGVTENASYYIFTQCPDGAFEAFPVHGWYNFTPQAKHRTLTAEEAEEEWGRRNKVVNHFSIMVQRRFREPERGDDEEEEGEKGGKKKKKGGRGGDLRIHDLEDDLEMSSDDSDSSMGEDGEGKSKKKKGSKRNAAEDSDDGDFEGVEVDYMSDDTSSEEDEPEKVKPSKTEDVPKGVDEMSDSEEESEEEKQNEEETKEEEEEEEGKKTPVHMEKKKKKGEKDSSGESDTSDDSDIEGEAASALFMKKRTPPKRGGGRGSTGSSRTGSRPGTPSIDSGSTSNTLRAAANKLEQSKRQMPPVSSETPAAKRLKMEPSPQSPQPSGKSTPQPASGKSTPSSSDVQLTEEAVRRYLIRKPMTTKDLLKKFQTKRTGLSSDQTVNVLAQILKRLNPERKNINDKMHFYLTE